MSLYKPELRAAQAFRAERASGQHRKKKNKKKDKKKEKAPAARKTTTAARTEETPGRPPKADRDPQTTAAMTKKVAGLLRSVKELGK